MATVIERVANALSRQPQGVPVGDLARQLGLSYQGVRNEIERSGRQHGIWIDRTYSPAVVRLRAGTDRPASARSTLTRTATPSRPDMSREPDWEGNVQARVCRWLIEDGWDLEQVADTATRERGTDVVARRQGKRIHVEVKGWPSRTYADPARQGTVKPTEPTNQALHWFAGATLSCLRLRDAHPDDLVVMAFPDRPRYRRLSRDIASSLRAVNVEVWFVGESSVDSSGDFGEPPRADL